MIEPVTGALLFSTFMSTLGGFNAAKKEKEAADNQARMEAEFAHESALQKLSDVDSLYSEQVARYAKAGVNPFSGSPMMILNETLNKGIEDANKIRTRGALQAQIISETGRARQTAGQINAVAGAISGGVSAYATGEQMRMRRTGVGSTN